MRLMRRVSQRVSERLMLEVLFYVVIGPLILFGIGAILLDIAG